MERPLAAVNHQWSILYTNDAFSRLMAERGSVLGDGGVIGADGYLSIADRKKDVIITGGENVSSIEVEDCLFSHPAVAEVAVIGVPSEKWGETIKALVVVKPDAAVTEADLIAWCKQRLAGYKSPTSVEFRTRLARTARGSTIPSAARRSLSPSSSSRICSRNVHCRVRHVIQRY